jgi:hypothetical protein
MIETDYNKLIGIQPGDPVHSYKFIGSINGNEFSIHRMENDRAYILSKELEWPLFDISDLATERTHLYIIRNLVRTKPYENVLIYECEHKRDVYIQGMSEWVLFAHHLPLLTAVNQEYVITDLSDARCNNVVEYGCNCKNCGEFYPYTEKRAGFVCRSCLSYREMYE